MSRSIIHHSRPARRGGGTDAPACASGDCRAIVSAAPAVADPASSGLIPIAAHAGLIVLMALAVLVLWLAVIAPRERC